MINTNSPRRTRRRVSDTSSISIWAEVNKKGGFIIYHGVKGTDTRTIVGGATSRETLEYNMRKAKHKYGYKLS